MPLQEESQEGMDLYIKKVMKTDFFIGNETFLPFLPSVCSSFSCFAFMTKEGRYRGERQQSDENKQRCHEKHCWDDNHYLVKIH